MTPTEMRKGKVQILDKRPSKEPETHSAVKPETHYAGKPDPKLSAKLRSDEERTTIRKREHKALMKSLQMAQMATASMGKFDKKLKKEPDAPKSQRVEKKKSNKHLGELAGDHKGEK